MTDGQESSGPATRLGPPANVSAEELQTMMRPVTLPPTMGRAAAVSAMPPPPPSEPTAMSRAAATGRTTERLDAIEQTVREIKDVLGGLKEQLTALVERMDGAGKKDDEHDGELVGLKAGLKDAEAAIKDVAKVAEAAQKAADAACKRLVEEFGEVY